MGVSPRGPSPARRFVVSPGASPCKVLKRMSPDIAIAHSCIYTCRMHTGRCCSSKGRGPPSLHQRRRSSHLTREISACSCHEAKCEQEEHELQALLAEAGKPPNPGWVKGVFSFFVQWLRAGPEEAR